MAKRRQTKRKSGFVPEPVNTINDILKADKLIAQMLAKRAQREARARERFARAERALKEFLSVSLQDIVLQFEELRKFVFEHRDELMREKKSATLLSGAQIEFYLGGKAVILDRNTKAEEFVERFKALGLTQFVRVRESVNKEALGEDPDKAQSITGITVRDPEEYFAYHPQQRTETIRYNLETGKIRLDIPDEESQGETPSEAA